MARGGRGGLISQNKQALHNRTRANEYHEQLEKVCQPAVGSKLVDSPKTDCAHDHNDQNANEMIAMSYPWTLPLPGEHPEAPAGRQGQVALVSLN